MSKLTGLRVHSDPPVHRCACGCGHYADRGYPGDLWYRTRCVPPTLRFPWEAGAVAPSVPVDLPPAPVAPRPGSDDAPLLPGFSPA